MPLIQDACPVGEIKTLHPTGKNLIGILRDRSDLGQRDHILGHNGRLLNEETIGIIDSRPDQAIIAMGNRPPTTYVGEPPHIMTMLEQMKRRFAVDPYAQGRLQSGMGHMVSGLSGLKKEQRIGVTLDHDNLSILAGFIGDSGIAGFVVSGGSGPQPSETRGMKTDDPSLFKVPTGKAANAGDPGTEPANYGEKATLHPEDVVVIGHQAYPTKWRVIRRHRTKTSTTTGAWETKYDTTYDLGAGQTQEIKNPTTYGKDEDHIYITLLTVGQTAAEATQTTKDKAEADAAIANAKGQISTLLGKGGDTASVQSTETAAEAAYSKADYKTATSTANSAASTAIDAIALIDKKNLDAEIARTLADKTKTQAEKDAIIKDLNDAKANIDTDTTSKKQGLGFTFGANTTTYAIVGVTVGTVIAAIVAAVLLRKK
jgi:hypothetical protein